MTRRGQTLLAAVLIALSLGTLWSYTTLASSRAAAGDQQRRTSDALALADRIVALRDRPATASATNLSPGETSRRISAAAEAAGIGPTPTSSTAADTAIPASDSGTSNGSIDRIEPEPARRVGESAYRESPTRIRLRKVTLKQTLLFLRAAEEDGAIRATAIRLSAPREEPSPTPRDQASPDTWTVELTLSHLQYAPR